MKNPISVDTNPIYQDDDLIRRLAREYQTPLYVFDEQSVRDRCAEVKAVVTYPNFQLRYACKALTLGAILQIIRDEGLWIDGSSINEVHRALKAGFTPEQIYFTGEGATKEIYAELVALNILINCTSIDQIHLLGAAGGKECSLRINPGEGYGANYKTNTGGPNSKHGIYFDQIEKAKAVAAEQGIKIIGIHSHVGSGGTDLANWLKISDKTLDIAHEFEDLSMVNLGGGMPVIYNPETDSAMPLQEWGAALSERMAAFSQELGHDIQLQIEPGRYLVAGCGLLVAQAQAVKHTSDTHGVRGKNYVIVDSGHNHNIRPAFYHSYHPIRFVAAEERGAGAPKAYIVAGNLCESGDVFTVDPDGMPTERLLEEVRVGDLMVMAGAGAYTHSMKSEYNSMNTPASVLVTRAGEVRLIERRGTLQDIMSREVETPEPGK